MISSVLGEGEGGATEGDLLSNGLRSSGVAVPQLRQRYGLNELQVEQPESLLAKLKEQFENPLILLLFGSALVSLFLGQYDDAFSIALVSLLFLLSSFPVCFFIHVSFDFLCLFQAISIVVTVAFIQEYRSEQSLHALNKLVPHYCHVLRCA